MDLIAAISLLSFKAKFDANFEAHVTLKYDECFYKIGDLLFVSCMQALCMFWRTICDFELKLSSRNNQVGLKLWFLWFLWPSIWMGNHRKNNKAPSLSLQASSIILVNRKFELDILLGSIIIGVRFTIFSCVTWKLDGWSYKNTFYHDVEEICWLQPIQLLKLSNLTGHGYPCPRFGWDGCLTREK